MRNIIVAIFLLVAACASPAPALTSEEYISQLQLSLAALSAAMNTLPAGYYGPGTQTTGTWSSGAASGMDN